MKFSRALMTVAAGLSIAGTLHTLRNLRVLRDPRRVEPAGLPTPRVSVLIPARNEARRITPTVLSVLQQDYPDFELIVLDDASTDATSQVVMNLINGERRARLITSSESPPAGWLGKPWACQRLAESATGEILVFVDADVRLATDALSQCVALMTSTDLDIMCPFPQQQSRTLLGKLVQPLLQWSWLTTLPLDVAETSTRPSLSAGNGQLLLVKSSIYRKVGGHEAVRDQVLEDINLVRAVKFHGGRGGVVDGSAVATCTMYRNNRELIEGYGKSLWNAFGSTAGAVIVNVALFFTYVLPLGFWFSRDRSTRNRAIAASLSATAGRIIINRRMSQGLRAEVLLHPLSVLAFNALTAHSVLLRSQGQLTWKDRVLQVDVP